MPTDQREPISPTTFRGSFSGRERDLFFYNPSQGDRFFAIGYGLGLDFSDDGRAVVAFDVDGDGDLDLATLGLQGLRLLENPLPRTGRHFARVRLRATRSQQHALGANVVVEAGGATQQDYVKATAGFQTQTPLDLHFGLGDATRIDRIEVRWPSGATQTHRDLPGDRLLLITEGGAPEARVVPAWPDERPRPLATHDAYASAQRWGGGDGPLAERGRPVVVNFWAPWCEPCREELPVLRALHDEFGDRIAFAGVSVETQDEEGVRRALAEHRLRYPQFLAAAPLLTSFFGGDGEGPVPATFVFDAAGRLRRAFHRLVSRDDLAPLLASLLDERPVVPYLTALAYDAALRGDYSQAREHYHRALTEQPDDPMAALGLAMVLYQEDRFDEAIERLRRITRLDPGQRRAWEVMAICYAVQGKESEANESCRGMTDDAARQACLRRVATTIRDRALASPKR